MDRLAGKASRLPWSGKRRGKSKLFFKVRDKSGNFISSQGNYKLVSVYSQGIFYQAREILSQCQCLVREFYFWLSTRFAKKFPC